ncbi:MAG: hypothetical protein JXB15_07820 [Anaerolineales bacterium]|nr:hypothetical protein [Anaerolineales bacterium]
MTEQPTQETIDRWHRYFAIEGNNGAWDLISKKDRTPSENQEMLNLAYAAAFHWSKIGTPVNTARAEITLAHVHALQRHGALAITYAQRCLDFFENQESADWDIAFAHLEMALAASVIGDTDLHARHYALAEKLGTAIKEEEDRKIFLDELGRIPGPPV